MSYGVSETMPQASKENIVNSMPRLLRLPSSQISTWLDGYCG